MSKYTESFESYAGSIRGSTTFKDVFNHQQSKINELLERLGKYEKKAQRDDKKICDMGIELFQVNERLRECEKSLRFYKWASLQELEENDQVQVSNIPNVWANGKHAREYFKKYEGK